MKTEIALRWAEALESGDYEQSHSYLKTDDGYCCLGVLCELAVEDGVIDPPKRFQSEDMPINFYRYSDHSQFLPPKVQEWAGMNSDNGETDGMESLIALNDVHHTPFSAIASIIREKGELL